MPARGGRANAGGRGGSFVWGRGAAGKFAEASQLVPGPLCLPPPGPQDRAAAPRAPPWGRGAPFIPGPGGSAGGAARGPAPRPLCFRGAQTVQEVGGPAAPGRGDRAGGRPGRAGGAGGRAGPAERVRGACRPVAPGLGAGVTPDPRLGPCSPGTLPAGRWGSACGGGAPSGVSGRRAWGNSGRPDGSRPAPRRLRPAARVGNPAKLGTAARPRRRAPRDAESPRPWHPRPSRLALSHAARPDFWMFFAPDAPPESPAYPGREGAGLRAAREGAAAPASPAGLRGAGGA